MSTRKSHFRTFKLLFRLWRDNLTITGKTIFGTLVLAAPSLFVFESALFQLFAALLMLMMIAGFVSLSFRPRVMVSIDAPPNVMCGEAFEVGIRLTNTSRRSTFDLAPELVSHPPSWHIEEPPPAVGALPAGESVHCRMTIHPTARGVFAWPTIRVTSTFPFHIFHQFQSFTLDQELIVYPQFQRLVGVNLLELGQSFAGDHFENAPQAGDVGEFFGNREYLPGMSVRRWDYGRWAKLGKPIVCEFHDSLRLSIAIFADTFLSADEDPECIEPLLSLAAALIDEMEFLECRAEFLVIGQDIVPIDPIQIDQRNGMFEVLAAALPCEEQSLEDLIERLEEDPAGASSAVVLLRKWDSKRERLCNALTATGHSIKRILVCPQHGQTPEQLSEMHVVTASQIKAGAVEIE